MILKRDLLDAIDCLTGQVTRQGLLIKELRTEVDTLKFDIIKSNALAKKKAVEKQIDKEQAAAKTTAKRRPGRPRKNSK